VTESDTNPHLLVTVAVATFNRAALLRRALQSVLSQDYENLEVIVGDNASEDETYLVRQALGGDRRVRWIRHETNRGALSNFEILLQEAKGHYFMWLADDDYLSPGYISRCATRLSEPDAPRNVVGRAVLRRDGAFVRAECFRYIDTDPRKRVLLFYRTVRANSLFYSMSTTDQAREVLPFMPGVSCDWVHVARHVYLGRAEYLDDVTLTVSLHERDSGEKVARGWHRQAYKMFFLASDSARDVCTHPVYAGLRPSQRRVFAMRCAAITFRRRSARTDLFCAVAMTLKRILPERPYQWLQGTWRRRRPERLRFSANLDIHAPSGE